VLTLAVLFVAECNATTNSNITINSNFSANANDTDGNGWPELTSEDMKNVWAELQKAAASNGARASFPMLIQPLSFVVFVMSDMVTGYVSYETLVAQVAQLNYAYSAEEATKEGYETPTDSMIRFQMAGVRYVVNDDYFNLCALSSTIEEYRPLYEMDGAIHLNVYICWSEYNLGLAWLPFQSWFGQPITESMYARGAIVHWQLLPGNDFNKGLWSKGNIMTHEIGHTFGLMHPYQGDCIGTEMNSDQIADTPRSSQNPLTTCVAVKGLNSCPTLPGLDDISNYMIATADSCRNHFTPGQVAYMQNVITVYKPTLLKQLLPSCVAAIDSTDNSPDLQPCLDGTVQTSASGKLWCKTDPMDSDAWGWACCPTSLNWNQQACWQGTPSFTMPKENIDFPATIPTKEPTNAPTHYPTRKKKKLLRF